MDFFSQFSWIYLYLVIFIVFIIINIFPVMFFLLPELFILTVFWLYLWWFIDLYLWFLSMFLWRVLWETISYIIWTRWNKIFIKYKNDKITDFVEKLKKNPIKTLFIGKLLPIFTWIVPFLSWLIRLNFYKFFIVNTLMIFWGLVMTFYFLYIWNIAIDKYFSDFKEYIICFIIFIILILFIKKIFLWRKF